MAIKTQVRTKAISRMINNLVGRAIALETMLARMEDREQHREIYYFNQGKIDVTLELISELTRLIESEDKE